MEAESFDVVVVGAGNAALSAALSAHEAGVERILVLEASSKHERGGNSTYTGGFFRFPYETMDDLAPMLNEESRTWAERVDVEPYPRARMMADMKRQSRNRCDPELTEILVERGYDAVRWLHDQGVRWQFPLGKVHDMSNLPADARYTLAGGAALVTEEEGVGLIDHLFDAVERAGIEVWYESPVDSLIREGSRVTGVRLRLPDGFKDVSGAAVILGSGGFGASPEMRERYLGKGWDLVKIRGSRFATGHVLTQALLAGAQSTGHWGGAHASALAGNAPDVGRIDLTDKMSRYSYPYSISVNIDGERFMDEGKDHLWMTYASTGSQIQQQPDARAYQIFDQKVVHLLEPRYELSEPVIADTIEELAVKLDLDPRKLTKTVADFNAATPSTGEFNPLAKDGLATEGLEIPKSNWAQPIDQGPFVAYEVTCGLTFTFGGIKIDTSGRVIDVEGKPIPGLWATGEITGGVFYHGYAAGSGLTFGTVFGRIAGREAATEAASASSVTS